MLLLPSRSSAYRCLLCLVVLLVLCHIQAGDMRAVHFLPEHFSFYRSRGVMLSMCNKNSTARSRVSFGAHAHYVLRADRQTDTRTNGHTDKRTHGYMVRRTSAKQTNVGLAHARPQIYVCMVVQLSCVRHRGHMGICAYLSCARCEAAWEFVHA